VKNFWQGHLLKISKGKYVKNTKKSILSATYLTTPLMMNKMVMALLIVVGLINFLPVIGVISATKITQAYSVELAGNDLAILLRHRALLFGIVGGFILYSVFVPQYQVAAMIMAAISMVGYLCVMWSEGGYNSSLIKVAIVDMVGVGLLVTAAVLKYATARS
jgi:hypothetical protein